MIDKYKILIFLEKKYVEKNRYKRRQRTQFKKRFS